MIVYAISLMAIIIILSLSKNISNLKNKGLFISFAILWLIAGLRNVSVGADTISYYANFSLIKAAGTDALKVINIFNPFHFSGFENGFVLYTYIISSFVTSFTSYLLISYGFIYYCFYRFIKKYSSDYLFSMILFFALFFFDSMNIFRQSLAMAMLTLGFGFIINRQFYKYLSVVLFATLVHQSSILMLIPYFLYGKKITHFSSLVYIVSLIPSLLFIDRIIYILANAYERYAFYIDRINSFSLGSILSLIIVATITVIIFTIYRINLNLISQNLNNNLKKSFYLKMMLFSTMIRAVAIRVNSLSRVADLFLVYGIVGIPDFFKADKK